MHGPSPTSNFGGTVPAVPPRSPSLVAPQIRLSNLRSEQIRFWMDYELDDFMLTGSLYYRLILTMETTIWLQERHLGLSFQRGFRKGQTSASSLSTVLFSFYVLNCKPMCVQCCAAS